MILRKQLNGSLAPVFESDRITLQKIKAGDDVEVTIKKPRNIAFHRKMFALLNLGWSNQDTIPDFDHYRQIVTMKARHVDKVDTGKGVVFFAKSLSFSKMDELEFEKVYNDVLTVIMDQLQVDAETINQEVANFM